jgi:hypothetical protein
VSGPCAAIAVKEISDAYKDVHEVIDRGGVATKVPGGDQGLKVRRAWALRSDRFDAVGEGKLEQSSYAL